MNGSPPTPTAAERPSNTTESPPTHSFEAACVHAHFAESATGRRVAASIATLINRSGLSIDQIKRCRRTLKALELGVEQARGKKLNGIEREAAARHYEQTHGQAPTRPQIGAASVWALSAPPWAIQAMPEPRRRPRPQRRRRNQKPRSPHITSANQPTLTTTPSYEGSAPQSLCGSSLLNLSVRKDHLTREARGQQESHNQHLDKAPQPPTSSRRTGHTNPRPAQHRRCRRSDRPTPRTHRLHLRPPARGRDRHRPLDRNRHRRSPHTRRHHPRLDLAHHRLNEIAATTSRMATHPTRLVRPLPHRTKDPRPSTTPRNPHRNRPPRHPRKTHRGRRAQTTEAPPASAEHRKAIRAQLTAALTARKVPDLTA